MSTYSVLIGCLVVGQWLCQLDFSRSGTDDKHWTTGEWDAPHNGVPENTTAAVAIVIVRSNHTVYDVVKAFILGDCYVVVRVGEDWFVDIAMNSDRDCGRSLKGAVRNCH